MNNCVKTGGYENNDDKNSRIIAKQPFETLLLTWEILNVMNDVQIKVLAAVRKNMWNRWKCYSMAIFFKLADEWHATTTEKKFIASSLQSDKKFEFFFLPI